jgi:hypothetical protein
MSIDCGPEIVDDHLRTLLGHEVRYGLADTSAGTGHHNDFVFYDPIWICHAFLPLACVDGAPDAQPEDDLVQRYRSA